MRRLAVSLLSVVAALAAAAQAVAAEEVREDDAGRPIRFDVRAAGVDVDWYAWHLRRAPHGDEIGRVVVRVVDWAGLRSTCGGAAAGCYRRNLIVVPAGRDRGTARVLLHEYGHHLDSRRGNAAAPEPNGTPLWWRARGMPELVRDRSVRRNYSRGWSRSVGEVFAEDYAYAVLGGRYRIEWLQPPDEVVRRALLADLGLAPPPQLAERRPAVRPVVIDRNGTLSPGERVSVPFGLLGPRRRVIVRARAGGAARIEVRCGALVRTRPVPAGGATATLDVRRLGPAECRASLVSTTSGEARFSLTVRLSIER
jgi:hypothetical protein